MSEPMADPFPETPGEREKRIEEVRALIAESGKFPVELRDEIAKHAGEFIEARITEGSGHFYGGQLGWTSWVIRNDHLDFVAALAPVASAIAAYATAVGAASPAGFAVALIFAALAVSRKLRAKSASLDASDYGLLMALKGLGPATPQQVADAMNGLRIYGRGMWSDQQVREVLQKLKTVRLGDGSIEAFAVETPDGRWSANGV
ncbi:MAG: hypothetical protein WD696_14800 [Bryobacteraceae bacterium]